MTAAAALALAACGDENDDDTGTPTRFEVIVTNTAASFDYPASGAFATPVDASSPAPIGPGQAYEVRFGAAPGARLSFATMFVHSNDLFYAPGTSGIALFDDDGAPISGDVTDAVMLWDAGTELNEEPGAGSNQAPRQAGPNTGAVDSNAMVRPVDDAFDYPAVADVLEVTITHEGAHEFTLRIANVSTAGTLMTMGGDDLAVPLAPGVFVVHTGDSPLLTDGAGEAPAGLEALAEDGDPSGLATALAEHTGIGSPFAPGAWAVHSGGAPIFSAGMADRGAGLEALAEDGDPSALVAALAALADVGSAGAFDTPTGAAGPGPLLPGASYRFEVEAMPGDRLSFATMFVLSNDLFVAPAGTGLALFDANGAPIDGDVTDELSLWDAGTELNQWPGAGPDQPIHQAGANTGAADADDTVREVDDGYAYPAVGEMLEVSIAPLGV